MIIKRRYAIYTIHDDIRYLEKERGYEEYHRLVHDGIRQLSVKIKNK
jgi:hypothetical protein